MYKTDNFKRFVDDTNRYKNNILRTRSKLNNNSVHNIDYTKLAKKKPSVNKFKLIDFSNEN